MPYLQAHGTSKPPLGVAQVHWAHPLVRALLFGAWANHPGVLGTLGTGNSPGRDILPTWGATAPRVVVDSLFAGGLLTSNLEGSCINCSGTTDYVDFGPDPIPAAQITICVIRKKRDGVNRNPGYTFGLGTPGTFTTRCTVSLPFSDGVTYFDFGGVASPNRLSIAGLTYSTVVPERWIFIAGSQGMAIWRNGLKLASTTTANPGRTVDLAQNFRLNNVPAAGGNGDIQDLNFFMALNTQWDDALCRWWSAEPYAHLYPPMRRRVLAGVAAPAGTAARTQVTMFGPW